MKNRFASNSIEGKLHRLALNIFLPMVLLAGLILMMLIVYNVQYSSITENITTASGFNQNFKADVDLKMYYYVIGSSDEIPDEEIRTARSLAQTLFTNTTNPDSRKAVGSVLGLCDSLNASIGRIQNTEGYDKRIEQLETNIYVITQLIEEYLYTYLYHEAGQLARLQHMLNVALVGEIAAVLLILAVRFTGAAALLALAASTVLNALYYVPAVMALWTPSVFSKIGGPVKNTGFAVSAPILTAAVILLGCCAAPVVELIGSGLALL